MYSYRWSSFPFIGILIPAPCVTDLRYTLEKVAEQAAGSAEINDEMQS